MARKKALRTLEREAAKKTHVSCPFTILIDTQEKEPYTFEGIESNSDHGNLPYFVRTERKWLERLGDYSLIFPEEIAATQPKVCIERKSKADFFGSIAKRDNWEERLARQCEELDYAAIIIESEWLEIAQGIPYSDMNFTSIHRTIQSWTIEYQKVHWFFYPGRDAAESACFWLLMRCYEKARKFEMDKHRKLSNYNVYHEGMRANRKGIAVTENPHQNGKRRTIGDSADWWARGWIDQQDINSAKANGKPRCSEPPEMPECIFSSDFIRKGAQP